MKRIIQKVKDLISPKKKQCEQYSEKLLEIHPGKSFKGHQAVLTVDNYNDDVTPRLYLYNKYFAGCVSYDFSNKNQITTKRVIHTYGLPKWLKEKRNNILNNIGNGYSYYLTFNVSSNIKIILNDYDVAIEKTTKEDGLKMYGHKSNINSLNEIKDLGTYFRKWIKKTDESKMEFQKVSTETGEELYFVGKLFK